MRRSGFSWLSILIGVAIGIGIGLAYTWVLDPTVITNTAPWQLSKQGQTAYMVAISVSYAKDHDLNRTVTRLLELRLGDKTWQALADTGCELARTNYASTNTGLTAIRSMIELARSQGAISCDSPLFANTNTPAPTPTFVRPTATLIPPPTKTLLPTLGATFTPATPVPDNLTPTPSGDFKIALIEPLCSAKQPRLLIVQVQDADGAGIPGMPVEVIAPNGKETFFTGLKPERGAGYADYQMTDGSAYTVSLPGVSEHSRPLEASSCNVAPADGGGKSTVSYRVTFRRLANAK